MPTRRKMMIGGAAMLALPTPAIAHRVNRTETTVEFLDAGAISVTHIYHVADAQDALFKAGLIDRPDIASLRARARLALYTADNFDVMIDGTPIALDLLGAELVGNSVYVYQEADNIETGDISVRATILHDLLKHQRNSVTVKTKSGSKTVVLTPAAAQKDVVISSPAP